MTTDRIIRDLRRSDIAGLQQIDTVAHGSPWSERTFLDDISGADRLHLVAEADGTVVGHAAAWIDGPSCQVTNVAVDASHAGQGHASALLIALLRQSMAQHRVANVQLEVRPSNRRAQRLYSRFGFVPVGIERNFYDRSDAQGSRDAVVMAVVDVCAEAWQDRLIDLTGDHETVQ